MKEDEATVKACPRCGKIALVCCWHPDTEEVSTVPLPVSKVRNMQLDHAAHRVDELELSESLHDQVMKEVTENIDRNIAKALKEDDKRSPA
jgi:hypothetical protein